MLSKEDICHAIAERALSDNEIRSTVKEMLADLVMLDTKRAARLLGYHPNHLRRLPIDHIQEGTRDRRYSLSALRAWRDAKLIRHRRQPTQK